MPASSLFRVRVALSDLKDLDAEAARRGTSRSQLIRERLSPPPRKVEPSPPPKPPPLIAATPQAVPLKRKRRAAPPVPRWCAAIAPAQPPPLGCVPADVVQWFGSLYAVNSIAEAQRLVAESGEGLAVYSIVISSQIDHDGHSHPLVQIAPIVPSTGGTSQDLDVDTVSDPIEPFAKTRKRFRATRKLKASGHSPEARKRAWELCQQVGGEHGVSWAAIGRMLFVEGITSKSGGVIRGHIARSMALHHKVLVLGRTER